MDVKLFYVKYPITILNRCIFKTLKQKGTSTMRGQKYLFDLAPFFIS